MKKLALVHQKHRSDWVSCQSITSELIFSYRVAFHDYDIKIFYLDKDGASFGGFQTAEKIEEFAPSVVAFIDHLPHPRATLEALKIMIPPDSFPRIIIHVFGDFTFYSKDWLALETTLAHIDIRFICASEKQMDLLKSFIRIPPLGIQYVPFPVKTDAFQYSSKVQNEFRGKLSKNEHDFIFLYAGRLSLQKNVLILLKAFSILLTQFNPDAHLWLAGPIDDFGIPYLGKQPPAGLFGYDFAMLVREAFPGPFSQHVRYFNNCDSNQLAQIYNAADAYVSFSTHNDEDFGLAPAEAALCGCPLLLTDWGGFSSFKKYLPAGQVESIPVKIGDKSVVPNLNDCIKSLMKRSLVRPTLQDRMEISASVNRRFSAAAVGTSLREIITHSEKTEFSRFSSLFHQVALSFQLSPDAPLACGHTYSELYRKVYATYA